MMSGRIWPASAIEVSPPSSAYPPLPAQPGPERALRRLIVVTGRCLAGALLREGNGGTQIEPGERERLIQLLWRMLLMVAACNAVRMTAMYVVAYGWVLVVAVGSSEMKVLPYDVCALRPYWWPLPPQGQGWDAGGGCRPQRAAFPALRAPTE